MTCAGAEDVRLYVLFGWESRGGHLKGRRGAVENFKPFKKRRVLEIVENGFNGEFNVAMPESQMTCRGIIKTKLLCTLLIFRRIFS